MDKDLNSRVQSAVEQGGSKFLSSSNGLDAVARSSTVVLLCPDAALRSYLTRAVETEGGKVEAAYEQYPGYDQVSALVESQCDAYIVDIDSDSAVALDLVETICSRKPATTVMVYSGSNQQDRMVAAMRAGAREFLTGTEAQVQIREALVRAVARNLERSKARETGKTFVFWPAKGGSGVSTLAANFAIALRAESGSPVLLVDMNPHIGDIAVLLGVTPRFTILDALNSAKRLDSEFLSTLVIEHKSGVSIVAAPDAYRPSDEIDTRAVAKFVDLARTQYPWVVIDGGRGLGAGISPLLQMANVTYLVTQLDIPSLRGASRFISYVEEDGEHHLEVVVNRHDQRQSEFDDDRLTKALGRPPKWKIPNDYAAARRASNTGEALIFEKSPAAQAIRGLARNACGKPRQDQKRASWSLFR